MSKRSFFSFGKKSSATLLKYQSYDDAYDPQEVAQISFKPIYNLSQNKLVALRK